MMQKIKGVKSKAAQSAGAMGSAAVHKAAHGATKAAHVGGTVLHATETAGHKVGAAAETVAENVGTTATKTLALAADGVEKGAHMAAGGIEKGVHIAADGAKKGTHLAIDGAEKGTHLAVDGVEKGGQLAAQGAEATIHAIVNPSETATKAAEVGGAVVSTFEQKVVNTARFLGDPEYREKEVLPHVKESFQAAREGIQQELHESDEMVHLLWRWGEGDETLTEVEKQQCIDQMADLAKVVPVIGIFMLPGGAVLLPLAAQLLPFELFPSAFSSDVETKEEARVGSEPRANAEPELEPQTQLSAVALGQPPDGTGPQRSGVADEDGGELRRGSTLVGTVTAGSLGDDEDASDD